MTTSDSGADTRLILLVEDQPDDETLTIRALRKSNLTNPIEVARDGAEALDFLFARGQYSNRVDMPLPSLIILDLNLPKISGLGVLKALRENEGTSMIPVVVMTSSKEEQDVVASYKLGANSYVRKPVDFAEFMEAAKTLGIYWMTLNQPIPKV